MFNTTKLKITVIILSILLLISAGITFSSYLIFDAYSNFGPMSLFQLGFGLGEYKGDALTGSCFVISAIVFAFAFFYILSLFTFAKKGLTEKLNKNNSSIIFSIAFVLAVFPLIDIVSKKRFNVIIDKLYQANLIPEANLKMGLGYIMVIIFTVLTFIIGVVLTYYDLKLSSYSKDEEENKEN
jgi:hypothetical protein